MKPLFIFILFLLCKTAYANALPPDAPERKQLLAMGFEIVKEDPKNAFTIAKIGDSRIIFAKGPDRLSVTKVFNRKAKLSQAEEFELLKIINILNERYSYQFSLSEQGMTANLYVFGSYDPRTFASVVRLMDRVETIFETQPNFFKLISN